MGPVGRAEGIYCDAADYAFLFPYPTFEFAFSEAGPFERLSIVAWTFAGAIVVLRARPYRLSAAGRRPLTGMRLAAQGRSRPVIREHTFMAVSAGSNV